MNAVDTFVKNLVTHLNSETSYTVVRQNNNESATKPVLVVGYTGMEQSGVGLFGHYTVNGFVTVQTVGYDDDDSSVMDAIQASLEGILCASDLETDLNAIGGVTVQKVIVRGWESNTEGSGNEVAIVFDAWIVA